MSADLLFESVFQTLTEASEDAEIVFDPSLVTATAVTAAVCPLITCTHSALATLQYLRMLDNIVHRKHAGLVNKGLFCYFSRERVICILELHT